MAKSSALLSLFAVLLLSGLALSMHEDEQGKRDWLRKGLGVVKSAVFHPKSKTLKQLYVISEQGALAALSTLNDGSIRWRHVTSSSNPFVAVAATDSLVTAITSRGHVYTVAASTGEVLSLRKIELAADGTARSCNSDIAVATAGSSVFWYNLKTDSEASTIAQSGHHEHKSAVTNALIGKAYIWVERNSTGIDTIKLADGAVIVTDVTAAVKAVSERDEALVEVKVNDDGGKFVTLMGTNGDVQALDGTKPTRCKNCNVGLLASAESGAAEDVAISIRSDKDGTLKISLGAKKKLIDLDWSVRGVPYVIACRSSPQKTELVLRSSSAHVLYLSITNDEVTSRWELLEGISIPAFVKVVPQPKLDAKEDHFGFKQLALVLSNKGTLYSVPVWNYAEGHVVVDVMAAILAKAGEQCGCGTVFKSLSVDASGDVATIVAEKSSVTYVVKVEVSTKILLSTTSFDSKVLVTPSSVISNSALSQPAAERQFLYTLDTASGDINGFAVAKQSTAVQETWSVRLRHPIVATTSGQHDALLLKTVESIRIFPNATTKLNEVRRKYPTTNVLVTAHYVPVADELTSLVVTAIDIITGSVLASTRHANVEGSVKLLLVENMVVYHFLDAESLQFKIGVWEMFEQEDGAAISDATPPSIPQIIGSVLFSSAKTFSSFAARPPVVASTVLRFQHDVAAMSVTTSFGGIARKLVLFATPNGRVHAVDLRVLTVGGNAHPQHKDTTFGYIITPSISIVSHRHAIAAPQLIASNPTELESSSHVIVAGLDLFYVRVSAGKAFDLLNDDFNHDMLLLVCGVMGALCLVARFIAKPRALYQQWA